MATTAADGPDRASRDDRGRWLRWVAANAVGEALGLGLTMLGGLALFPALEASGGLLATLAVAVVAVAAGTAIEGLTVGTAQWLVLRRPLPRLTWRVWAGATAAGAGLAWTLGMLPSTLLSFGEEAGGAATAEPSAAVVYTLAFLMGLVLGPVLGCAQWLVLRRHVPGAWLWMPANALAWGFGMVLAFAGVSFVADRGFSPLAVASLVATLAATGAVVGAIHGLALVRLLQGRGAAVRPGGVPVPMAVH